MALSRLSPGQRSTAFGGGHQDFLAEQVSTAFSGAEHVYGSPVPGERPDYGRLHGSVAGQSSTACRGAHLHQLLPEDVVNEELQERLAAHVLSLERTRSVVLFPQRSKLYDEAGQGRARALRGSGVAELIQHSSGEVRFLWRTSCASARLSSSTLFLSTPPHAGEFVGGPLSSLTMIPRLRTFWWCSRQRNLPYSSRMRSKQPRRHSLYDGIMRAAAVLVGEKRALVFRYGVRCSPLEFMSMDFSGRRLLVCFPYSVLLGSTVDTCMALVYLCGLSSTAPCTWQFVRCCCLRSACADSSGDDF